ncbi:hypothetical protein [Endozoicomonas sp. ALC020]|uniref:hypothetical protein n=1 Tax=unclassified Endozoicomonas TaxID=2644528 RepID=UPI003BB0C483
MINLQKSLEYQQEAYYGKEAADSLGETAAENLIWRSKDDRSLTTLILGNQRNVLKYPLIFKKQVFSPKNDTVYVFRG